MSNITLPSRVVTAPGVPAAASPAPGTISDPPAALRHLALGSYLQGTVVEVGEKGQVLVRTEMGTLPVATKAPLTAGAEVVLQIRSSGSQLHVVLMQVEGQPVAKGGGTPAEPRPAIPLDKGAVPAARPDAVAGKPVPATIANPPPAAAHLVNGEAMHGHVLGRSASGQLLVRTELGTLPLVTDAAPPTGSQVRLVVRAVLPQLNVLVAPLEAENPGGQTGHAAARPLAGTASGPGHSVPTADVLTLGQQVRATLLAAPNGANAGISLALGSQIDLQVRQIVPPSPGGGQAAVSGSSAPAPVAGATAAAPGGGPIPPLPQAAPSASAPHTPSVPGPTATATPSVMAPAPVLPAALPSEPATPGNVRVSGLVTGATSAGEPLVRTEVGTLSLGIKTALPAGTRVILELPASALASGGSTAPSPQVRTDPASIGYAWPALVEMMEAIDKLDPQIVEALRAPQSSAALPQPGPRLASAMLFFFTALNGGAPGIWLDGLLGGQASRLLEQAGRGDLIARIKNDLGQLARLSEGAGGDWRLFALPFFDGQQHQQLRFFLRDRHGGARDSGAEGDEATRFVLDVELSRLGELQLDGLVRDKRFDLILRSRQPLPERMRREISSIFEEASTIAGSRGQVAFQASTDWSAMAVEIEGGGSPSLVI